jgi:hypothetical protein
LCFLVGVGFRCCLSEKMSALDQVLRHGRKRGRELFPENIPGLYPLAKSDVLQDLDCMLGPQMDRRALHHLTTNAAGRANTPPPPNANNNATGNYTIQALLRPQKRSRLIERVTKNNEQKEEQQQNNATGGPGANVISDVSDISQKDLRNSLDVLRDDNKKLQIDIDLKTKQVAASQKDKEKKMETYGEIIKQFEERQAQMKKDADLHQLHLTNLKSSIIQITQQVSF